MGGRLGCKGADEGRLADTRLSPDQHESTLAIRRGGQECAQSLLLPLPSDQAGQRQGPRARWCEGRRRGHDTSGGLVLH